MLSANFKPKTTAAVSRGFLATARLSVSVGDDKKEGRKGKGMYHIGPKGTKRLYFSYMGSRPPWTDLYKNWQD